MAVKDQMKSKIKGYKSIRLCTIRKLNKKIVSYVEIMNE